MSSRNPEYCTFRPTKLKVSRLGVNISKQMNDSLNLDTSQYMIVGEHYVNQGGSTSNTYSLIVDDEGIAVNTSLASRQQNSTDYPIQLNGTVYIDGNLIVTGLIGGSNSSNILGGGGGSNFWKYAGNNNIYYDGKVNISSYNDADENTYSFSISEPSNKDIQKAQLSIQNRQLAEYRIAILGNASNSPVVLNTPEKTPIEFHVGRKQSYFTNKYLRSYSNDCAEWIENEPIDSPIYSSPSEAPHLNIDINGNVGIHTNFNPKIAYTLRRSDPQYPDAIQYSPMYESMALHVDGPLYASNILIYDYENKKPKNLDELFVRIQGETIFACNIIPGAFAHGVYQFRSNISIMATPDDRYALLVDGIIKTHSNVFASNVYATHFIEGEDLYIRNTGSFSNNIVVQNNIYFKANLFKERINPSTGSNEWSMIQFDSSFFAEPSLSNLYYIGDGVATIGRMGIGVLPTLDEINHQTVIRKRDDSIFELEMMDRSSINVKRTAYIGHPKLTTETQNDASLVFVTPSKTNVNYNIGYYQAPQNIYFFPGYESSIGTFTLQTNNPPVLGVFESKKVGINKYSPDEALDVVGNIQLSGELYTKGSGDLSATKLGRWTAKHYSYVDPGSNLYDGIEYIDSSAPHVGINTIPRGDYGLTVSGKLLSTDGYYTNDGFKISPWYKKCCENDPLPPSENMFSLGRVGIGLRTMDGTVHLKDATESTRIRLSKGENNPSAIVQLDGARNNYMMHLYDTKDLVEFYYGASNDLYTSTANRPLILKKGNTIPTHQVIINSNHDLLTNTNDALMVNGNVRVYGDVNITGQYRIQGSAITITNSQAEYIPTDNVDDIYIAGANILMNPNQSSQKSLYIGFNESLLAEYASKTYSTVNIFQRIDDPDHLTARFSSESDSAFIQLDSRKLDKQLNFGITEYNDLSFFTTNRASPFFAFKESTPGVYTVGFGTTSANQAQVQIYNDTSYGSNTFKVTKKTNVDSAGAAPGITLEKLTSTASVNWKFIGPERSYQQKLQVVYQDLVDHKELYTFTNTGCFGIGNTRPQFALDIISNRNGSLRLLQTDASEAKPQILFQCGSNQYGADDQTDYRLYAYSNNFYLDMQNQALGQKTLFHFTSNTALGIHGLADSTYNVNIHGKLNVTDSIYIDGVNILSMSTGSTTSSSIIRGCNIFLLPSAEQGGGVTINYPNPTCNIFHIASGLDGNMMVLDSAFNESQINFRVVDDTFNSRIYRLATSNQSFILEYSSNNIFDVDFTDKHEGFQRVIEWIPTSGPAFNMILDGHHLPKHTATYNLGSSGKRWKDIYLTGASIDMDDLRIVKANSQFVLKTSSNDDYIGLKAKVLTLETHDEADALTISGSNFTDSIQTPFSYRINSNGLLSVGTGHTQTGRFTINENSGYPAFVTNQKNNALDQWMMQYNGETRSVFNAYGNLGIGTTLVDTSLYVSGNTKMVFESTEANPALYVDGTSVFTSNLYARQNVEIDQDIIIHGNTIQDSDIRIKYDLRPIESALDKIEKLTGYTYQKLHQPTRQTGLVAQEVQQVLPEAVYEQEDGILGLAYGNLMGLMVEGIKELRQELKDIKSKINI
jgi:hypothetical protein